MVKSHGTEAALGIKLSGALMNLEKRFLEDVFGRGAVADKPDQEMEQLALVGINQAGEGGAIAFAVSGQQILRRSVSEMKLGQLSESAACSPGTEPREYYAGKAATADFSDCRAGRLAVNGIAVRSRLCIRGLLLPSPRCPRCWISDTVDNMQHKMLIPEKSNFFSLSPDEIDLRLEEWGWEKYRGRQLREWIYHKLMLDPGDNFQSVKTPPTNAY